MANSRIGDHLRSVANRDVVNKRPMFTQDCAVFVPQRDVFSFLAARLVSSTVSGVLFLTSDNNVAPLFAGTSCLSAPSPLFGSDGAMFMCCWRLFSA
uniref:Uncharacterized protein n=1 Tax=Steinernema glaseri TaxID=37863 RepID=A0A1I8AGV5_9BILA